MEKECNIVTLNGIEYTEIRRINNDGNTYVVLTNISNPEDFCIKKLITEDGVDYINGLDNEAEFNKVVDLLVDDFKN